MDFISLNAAISLTGLSRRTLWRRIADGALRTEGKSFGPLHAYASQVGGGQTRVALDDVLTLSPLRVEPEDRVLIVEADAGDAAAQCDLGLVLLGQGRPADAMNWFEQSARLECLEGMHWLGRCLIAGQGVTADERRGIDWIARAANHGHATARAMMPYLYDPARPALGPADLDAELDRIERKVVLDALEASVGP